MTLPFVKYGSIAARHAWVGSLQIESKIRHCKYCCGNLIMRNRLLPNPAHSSKERRSRRVQTYCDGDDQKNGSQYYEDDRAHNRGRSGGWFAAAMRKAHAHVNMRVPATGRQCKRVAAYTALNLPTMKTQACRHSGQFSPRHQRERPGHIAGRRPSQIAVGSDEQNYLRYLQAAPLIGEYPRSLRGFSSSRNVPARRIDLQPDAHSQTGRRDVLPGWHHQTQHSRRAVGAGNNLGLVFAAS
jgi:hypothetical protein